MAGLTAASDFGKTALVLLLGSGLILIISYGSPYWTSTDEGNAGLWTGCTGNICYERYNQWISGWLRTAQVFMTLSLIFWSFSTVCMVFYIFHRSCEDDFRLLFLSACLIIGSAFFILISLLVWVSNEHFGDGATVNWSFAMAGAAGILHAVTGFFIIQELRRDRK